MLDKKGNKESGNTTLASVKKEMAKPRVAKSARAPVRAGEVREPRLGPKEVDYPIALSKGSTIRIVHKLNLDV